MLISAEITDEYCPSECNPNLPNLIPWQGDRFREFDKYGNEEGGGASNPSWSASTITTSINGGREVFIEDMDGDGDLDIVGTSNADDKVVWYENNGAADPSFTATNIDTNSNGAQDIHVADIDKDGDMDIAIASQDDDSIAWYENNGAADPSFR